MKAIIMGQIKLALKLAGRPISNEDAGPVTSGVWMRKRQLVSQPINLKR
jgi:hypothetical protein